MNLRKGKYQFLNSGTAEANPNEEIESESMK